MVNMQARTSSEMTKPVQSAASSRHFSRDEADRMITLLIELRETTLSRATHSSATLLIVQLGGAERLSR